MAKENLVDLSSSDGIDIRLIAVPMTYVESQENEPIDDYYYCSLCKKRLHGERKNDYKEKPHNLFECLSYLIEKQE